MRNTVLQRDLNRIAVNGGLFEERVVQTTEEYIDTLEASEERLHKLEQFLNGLEVDYPSSFEELKTRAIKEGLYEA